MMRYLRAASGIVIGYAVVAAGLMLIVTVWWVNRSLPVGPVWIAVIALGLVGIGWVAGLGAAAIGGELGRAAVHGLGILTLAVLSANIILGIATEPRWFTVLAIALLIPSILMSGSRWLATRRAPTG